MSFSASHYADDTDFERFMLDRLGTHRVRAPEAMSIHDIRGVSPGSTGSIIVKAPPVGSASSAR
jgi:hypothetical protein